MKRSLAREIGAALIFKAIALAALYFAFFNGPHRQKVTPADMTTFLTQDATPARR